VNGEAGEESDEQAAGKKAKQAVPLAAQTDYFNREFPESFAGKKWSKEHRKSEGGKSLKRHRDAAVALTRELLAKDTLDAAIAAGNPAAVIESLTKIADSTDLVSKAQASPLSEINAMHVPNVASSVRELIHGGDAFALRFEHFVVALGKARRPIEFASLDGNPVDFIVLIAGPDDQHERYLQLLARITLKLKDAAVRRTLRAAEDIDAILQALA